MVTKILLTTITINILMTPCIYGDPIIHSITIDSEHTLNIKPYQPVYFTLQIGADLSNTKKDANKIAIELADRIVINGVEFNNDFRRTSVNPVAAIFVDKESYQRINNKINYVCVVMLYLNTKSKDYLFDQPGIYSIQLFPEGNIDVVVNPPTNEEKNIISEIHDMGLEFAMYIINQGEPYNKKINTKVDNLLEKFPNTSYTPILSICRGISKLRSIKYDPELTLVENTDKRVNIAKKYLEKYCDDDIGSLHEASATFYLAREIQSQIRHLKNSPDHKTEDLRKTVLMLMNRVANSPYSLDNKIKAKDAIRSISNIP